MLRLSISHTEEVECKICKTKSKKISKVLGVCVDCIRVGSERAMQMAETAHFKSRSRFKLPSYPPADDNGIGCKICANACKIPENSMGFAAFELI